MHSTESPSESRLFLLQRLLRTHKFPYRGSVYVYASGPAGEFIRVREYFGELLNRSGGVQDSEYEAEGFKALRQLLFLTLSRPSSRCCADPPDVQILKLKHKNKNKMWSTDGLS
ncbi:hypothetical protein PHYBLDRAFT_142115 [Phycomyces blakesleeanus NRRL 1555(-)]|uniref:Uncharacterized protein n=1 Tax=Phycomyces blakesleeanus (strain ATCC 8743b / DSM 1359 / FGSC 10004 / NBRC 33097 / NRRL 1555) TaxID=763407 RepID=A0A163AYN7_PHYB8|nr:hypothetical protein PHYBLDRAFT_142115 [Phycomyces blakesleeanus NRRL 1555(-)]OAD76601.1 hypothetical protein PHYBLDRAFT_142115 [Phycomyces blakesleeanus NRRL 1555(-)]|eukprot:XP_018294641.1 hypothetical protein PHYBLDRAFT_142115 [Phycomyces blakesleeanus NRRL 1555(-)]